MIGDKAITIYGGEKVSIYIDRIHKIAIGSNETTIRLRVRKSMNRLSTGHWDVKVTAEGYCLNGRDSGLNSGQILGAVDYACKLLGAEPSRDLKRIFDASL